MKARRIVLFVVAGFLASTIVAAQGRPIDGSAAAIRKVVSGKRTGDDVMVLGKSMPGSAGTFERKGRPNGTYAVGYGTILIRRGQDLHGHVPSVSVPTRMLYLSTEAYRCGG